METVVVVVDLSNECCVENRENRTAEMVLESVNEDPKRDSEL